MFTSTTKLIQIEEKTWDKPPRTYTAKFQNGVREFQIGLTVAQAKKFLSDKTYITTSQSQNGKVKFYSFKTN